MAVWAMVAAAAMKAVGELQAADAQSEAHQYNADVAQAKMLTEQQQTTSRDEALRSKQAQILGQQRAAIGQAGVGLDGSAAAITKQSAINAELDSMMTRYEGDLRAWGFQAERKQEKFAASTAKKEGYFKAAGTILNGAGNYFGGGSI
jgi:hypothetical protein